MQPVLSLGRGGASWPGTPELRPMSGEQEPPICLCFSSQMIPGQSLTWPFLRQVSLWLCRPPPHTPRVARVGQGLSHPQPQPCPPTSSARGESPPLRGSWRAKPEEGKCRASMERPRGLTPPPPQPTSPCRVNCSEYFPLFLATLWVAGIFFHEGAAALCGLAYLFARLRYFQGYARSAQLR
ncbi:PREDICTED: leukotriene C4 synthase isoform X1 [Propithecus coquereli]|uniref:leukotriene C4 synthase isoform X1 n=1 Tax=Propithecus coquereli TaxID=379532 RepID=UPI00063F321C|nr:PREDICTED: leukotriene C4 synthase isoform X1 [Propithecus coquereli]